MSSIREVVLEHYYAKKNLGYSTYYCDYCKRRFKKLEKLASHVTSCHNPSEKKKKKLFSCSKCIFYFKTKKEFKIHSLKHIKKKHVCKYCKDHFNTSVYLATHIKSIHELSEELKKTYFKCHSCCSYFKNNNALGKHLKKIHIINKGKIDKEKSKVDNEFSDLLRNLKALNSQAQPDILAQAIGNTKLDFVPNIDLQKVVVLEKDARTKLLKCELCSFTTTKISVLNQHLVSHSNAKIYQCPNCTARFGYIANLKKHMKKYAETGCIRKKHHRKKQKEREETVSSINKKSNMLDLSMTSPDLTNFSADDSLLNNLIDTMPDRSLPNICDINFENKSLDNTENPKKYTEISYTEYNNERNEFLVFNNSINCESPTSISQGVVIAVGDSVTNDFNIDISDMINPPPEIRQAMDMPEIDTEVIEENPEINKMKPKITILQDIKITKNTKSPLDVELPSDPCTFNLNTSSIPVTDDHNKFSLNEYISFPVDEFNIIPNTEMHVIDDNVNYDYIDSNMIVNIDKDLPCKTVEDGSVHRINHELSTEELNSGINNTTDITENFTCEAEDIATNNTKEQDMTVNMGALDTNLHSIKTLEDFNVLNDGIGTDGMCKTVTNNVEEACDFISNINPVTESNERFLPSNNLRFDFEYDNDNQASFEIHNTNDFMFKHIGKEIDIVPNTGMPEIDDNVNCDIDSNMIDNIKGLPRETEEDSSVHTIHENDTEVRNSGIINNTTDIDITENITSEVEDISTNTVTERDMIVNIGALNTDLHSINTLEDFNVLNDEIMSTENSKNIVDDSQISDFITNVNPVTEANESFLRPNNLRFDYEYDNEYQTSFDMPNRNGYMITQIGKENGCKSNNMSFEDNPNNVDSTTDLINIEELLKEKNREENIGIENNILRLNFRLTAGRKYRVEELLRKCLRIRQLLSQTTIKDFEKAKWKMSHVCGKCNKRFMTKSNLDDHILIVHDKIDHICDTCGKTLKSKKSFTAHLKQHSKPFNVQCQVCNATVARTSLPIHMRKHNNLTPFLCLLCNRTFKTYSSKRCHIINHHIKKNQGKFSEPSLVDLISGIDDTDSSSPAVPSILLEGVSQLQAQYKLPEKTKPQDPVQHLCNVCGKSFEQRRTLYYHVKRHERTLSCDCGATFNEKNSLNLHKKKYHNPRKPKNKQIS